MLPPSSRMASFRAIEQLFKVVIVVLGEVTPMFDKSNLTLRPYSSTILSCLHQVPKFGLYALRMIYSSIARKLRP
jgi:hypothetical protein